MDPERLASEFEALRPELTGYLRRLVARADVADDLAQTAALRALEAADRAPERPEEIRPWIYRIATNLGIDEMRRRGRRRDAYLIDAKAAAERNPAFVRLATSCKGSPETAAVGREHLAVCFGCTLGQLAPEEAAALLLKEIHGFTTEEVADLLGARFAQVKNWIQQARAAMTAKYARTCALIRKQGPCWQCVELDAAMGDGRGDPLRGTPGDLEARFEIVRSLRSSGASRWERLLLDVFDELG
jgi:RNA polymerase sigma-70 factor (ECF subfamily)